MFRGLKAIIITDIYIFFCIFLTVLCEAGFPLLLSQTYSTVLIVIIDMYKPTIVHVCVPSACKTLASRRLKGISKSLNGVFGRFFGRYLNVFVIIVHCIAV